MNKTNNYYELFNDVHINQKYKIVIIDKRFYFKMPINYEFEFLQIRQITLQDKKKFKILNNKDHKTETIKHLSSSKKQSLYKPRSNLNYLTFEMNNLISYQAQNIKEKCKDVLNSKTEIYSKDHTVKRYSFLKCGILHVNNASYNMLFKKAKYKIRRIYSDSHSTVNLSSNVNYDQSESSKLKGNAISGSKEKMVPPNFTNFINFTPFSNSIFANKIKQKGLLRPSRFNRKIFNNNQRFSQFNVLPSLKEENTTKDLQKYSKKNNLNQTSSHLNSSDLKKENNEQYKDLTNSFINTNK